MRNRFGGQCYRCGLYVSPGEGHFERLNQKKRDRLGIPYQIKWLIQHANCAIKFRGTDTHTCQKVVKELRK